MMLVLLALLEFDTVWTAEDIPGVGTTDWDANDVALRHNARCLVTGGGEIQSQEVHGVGLAAGAQRTNALRISFPAASVPPTSVEMSIDGGPSVWLCDGGATICGPEIELFADFRDAFVAPVPAPFVNTDGTGTTTGRPFTVKATFDGATFDGPCRTGFSIATVDGVVDATTTLPDGRPLVMQVADYCPVGDACPTDPLVPFQVPLETTPVESAYGQFMTWLADAVDGCTGPCAAEDWYRYPGTSVIDRGPAVATTAPLEPQPTCSDGVQNAEETAVDCGGPVCGGCWPIVFGGEGDDVGTGIARAPNGRLYVTGYTDGDAYGYTNGGSYDFLLARYHQSTGFVQWGWIGGLTPPEQAWAVAVSPNGANVAMVGEEADNTDVYIYETADGTDVVATYFGTGADSLRTVAYDPGGGILVAGEAWHDVAWDNPVGTTHTDTHAGGGDAFLMRLSSGSFVYVGYPEWMLLAGGANYERINDVVVGTDYVFVVGETTGDAYTPFAWQGGKDWFVAAYDRSGTGPVWTQQFGTAGDDVPNAVALAGTEIVVVGSTNGGLFGEGPSTGHDVAYATLSRADGALGWAHTEVAPGDQIAEDVVVDSNGAFLITGRTSSAYLGAHAGAFDGYLARYGAGLFECGVQFGSGADDLPEGLVTDGTAAFVVGTTAGYLGRPQLGGTDGFVKRFLDPCSP